tara:strand:- start:1862 stop:3010 length:1149 start_codon:yes stop_codon:yes gene_type:complete
MRKNYKNTKFNLLNVVLLIFACSSSLEAETDNANDWIWDWPTIYNSQRDSSHIQNISVGGIIHYHYAIVDSTIGNESDIDVRRFRIGPKMKFLDNFLLSGKVNLQPEGDELYKNLSTINLTFSPFGNEKKDIESKSTTIGKQRIPFTKEFSTSSKKIKTFERSLLVNQLAPNKATGISFREKKNKFDYSLGLYSGDRADEFSNLQEDHLLLGKLKFELNEETNLAIDYLYSMGNQSITSNIQDAYSLSLVWNESYNSGNISTMIDFIYAGGREEQPDASGIVIIPSYKINENLELVGRYQFAKSESEGGLRLQKRYERLVTSISGAHELGDSYHAGYFGVNYFLDGQRLKIMTGVEFSSMKQASEQTNYEAWTLLTGVRMSF